jgi:deazaflavin-dependent oxidoreductase (nitroreductase family)
MGRPAPRNAYDRLRPLRRLLRPVEAAQVRWFGASLVSTLARTPVLLLHTTGRRSGRRRTTPLAFHRDRDGSLIVVGGAGGQAGVPDWVANLRADATAAVTVERRHAVVTATEVVDDEHRDLWPQLAAVWPRIVTYRRRAGRPVPVFRLTPPGSTGTSPPAVP